MTKIETLRMIITKCSSIAAEAGRAIIAINKKSPITVQRCNFVALNALDDPSAEFTDDERAAIAELMSETESEGRDYMLRVRLTSHEHTELEKMAGNLSVSEYVRRKLFGTG